MTKFLSGDTHRDDPLEPWEDEDSRARREAWRPKRREVHRARGEGSVIPQSAGALRTLAKIASQQAAQAFALKREAMQQLEELRAEIARLHAHQAGYVCDAEAGPAPWLRAVDGEVRALGASREATQFASELARLLPDWLPAPEVSLDPDGQIAFDWQRAPRLVVTVTVAPDATLYFAGLFGGNRNHGREVLSNELPPAIAANLHRLFSEELETGSRSRRHAGSSRDPEQ